MRHCMNMTHCKMEKKWSIVIVLFVCFCTIVYRLSPPPYACNLSVIKMPQRRQNTQWKVNLTQHCFCFKIFCKYCGDIIIVMPLGHHNWIVKKGILWQRFFLFLMNASIEIHRSMGKISHSQGVRSKAAQFGKCLVMMFALNWRYNHWLMID